METVPFDRMYPSVFRDKHALPEPTERDLQFARAAGMTALPRVIIWSEKDPEGRYPILLNCVTWRVAQTLGIEAVPVEVFHGGESAARDIAQLEFGPATKVSRAKSLIAEYDDGAGPSPIELAQTHHMDRTLVWHLLSLKDLDPEVWELLEENKIKEGHARLLSRLPHEEQRVKARQAAEQQLSVRNLRNLLKGTSSPVKTEQKKDPNVARLEQQISETLGAPVTLRTEGNKGELIVVFDDLDILDGILERLGLKEY